MSPCSLIIVLLFCRLSEAPSRFNVAMDFAEGWGLYVEKLGIRMGLYEDPMSLFGHYYVGKERF